VRTPSALAVRVTALATPLLLGSLAVPSGGLFRAAKFRDLHLYREYGDALLDGRLPYRDVFVEYPPGAIPLFALPSLAPGGWYDAVFKVLMTLCAIGTIYLVVLLLASRGAGVPELALAAAFLALVPIALGPVSLNTYDAWPALLTVGTLAALVYGRGTLAFALLGAAFAAKLYPVVLVPLALVHIGRAAVGRALAAFAIVAAVFVVPWLALSPRGVWESTDAQLGRGLHAESLGASVLLAGDRVGAYDAHVVKRLHPAATRDLAGGLPHALGILTSALALLAVVAVWLAYYRRPGRLEVAFGAAIAGVLAFAKVLSPQYVVWLIPFVPFGGIAAAVLFVAALALAQSWYFHYRDLWAVGPQVWPLLARNALLVALYALFLWKTSTPSRAKTSFQSGRWRSRTSAAAAGSGADRSA
jgi:glycosyl transferase family 87